MQPAAGDAGTSVGAASYVAMSLGEPVQKMEHVYLGPSFSTDECIAACRQHPRQPTWARLDDAPARAAQIIADGQPLAWFQGRMEFGPRALGNRSILGDPSRAGMAERINAQIKYRERWRPFCPSVLDTVARDLVQSDHPAQYMTIAFDVAERWKARIPEVVHKDGSARVQVVSEASNPRFYRLIERARAAHRQRRRAQHLHEPPRRADRLHSHRRARHVLRLGPPVLDHGRHSDDQALKRNRSVVARSAIASAPCTGCGAAARLPRRGASACPPRIPGSCLRRTTTATRLRPRGCAWRCDRGTTDRAR